MSTEERGAGVRRRQPAHRPVVAAVIGVGVVGAGIRSVLEAAGIEVADAAAADVLVAGVAPAAGTEAVDVARHWRRPFVAVLTEPDQSTAMSLVGAGVAACGVVGTADSWLPSAVAAAASGLTSFDPVVAGWLAAAAGGRPETTAPQLSAREVEVLALAAEGLANKQIARRLGIAERTVKAHLTKVFSCLGVTSRTSAAVWWNRHTADATASETPRVVASAAPHPRLASTPATTGPRPATRSTDRPAGGRHLAEPAAMSDQPVGRRPSSTSRSIVANASRNDSRQRFLVGPMLPTGIPKRAAAAS